VAAVFAAAAEALEIVRAEGRPFLLECVTYRVRGHSKSDGAEYRPAGELD
jgi:TPP-dependent pyruvate/acetoin dehydrogenase alpha subunit